MSKPTYAELERKVQALESQINLLSENKTKVDAQDLDDCEESEEKYKILFENMAQGAFYQRSDGALIDCNPAALEMFGLTRDQFLGKTSMAQEWHVIKENGSKLPGDQHPSMVALTSGKPVYNFLAAVYNPRKKDCVWLNINAIPQIKKGEEKPYQVFVTLHDVTSIKQTEAALAASEKRFRSLTSLTPGGIYLTDTEGNCVYANEAWLAMAGMSFDEAMGSGWVNGIYPVDRERIKVGWYQMVESKGVWRGEYRFTDRKGNITWVYGVATPVFEEDNTITGYIGLNIDITERKQAEEALVSSEQKNKNDLKFLQLIVDTIPVRLFWKDLSLNYLGCNQLFAHDAGLNSPEQLIGADDYSLAWKEQAELYRKDDLEVIQSGSPKLGYEELQTTPHGHQITLLTSKVPIRNTDNEIIGLLGTYEDITSRKAMEKEAIRSQKLESLGRLAGGIAHNLNNILMSILGNISLAKMYSSPANKEFKRLIDAETACMKAKELSQQFLIFSKGGEPLRKPTATADLIKINSQLALSGTQSTCSLIIPDDLWDCYVDDGQIGQVLTNLLINADQSMPNGGMITLGCENITIGTDSDMPLQDGDYIKISIKDQGIGIKKEDLNYIFDPYFSTKPSGSDLGLPLRIPSYGDTRVTLVWNRLRNQALFSLFFLPRAIFKPVKDIEVEDVITQGKGRILVMDDDRLVLDAVGAMLDHLGYEFETAEDGEKALILYKESMQSGRPFDLVLMDLIIPNGMGGKEASQKLLLLDPQAQIVVSSGYSNDPVIANHEQYGFCGRLQKPFHLKELSGVLNSLLVG